MSVAALQRLGLNQRLVIARRLSPLMKLALTACSLAVLAAGAFALYAGLASLEPPAPEIAPEWRPPSFVAEPPLEPKPAASDPQTLARPIFSKSRRPKPPEEVETEEKPQLKEFASATGLAVAAIVRHGAQLKVFVTSPGNPEGDWYGAGDAVGGWTIGAVDAAGVNLTNGAQSARLKLYPDPSEQAEPPPAAAAPPRVPPKVPARQRGGGFFQPPTRSE